MSEKMLNKIKNALRGKADYGDDIARYIFRVFNTDAPAWDYFFLRSFILGESLPPWARGDSLRSQDIIKRRLISPIQMDLSWNLNIALSFCIDCANHVAQIERRYNPDAGNVMVDLVKTLSGNNFSMYPKSPKKYGRGEQIPDNAEGFEYISNLEPSHFFGFLFGLRNIKANQFYMALDDLSGAVANMFDEYQLSLSEHECYDSKMQNGYELECMWQSLRMVSYLFGELRVPSPPPSTEGVPP